jgi:hypothetical protein
MADYEKYAVTKDASTKDLMCPNCKQIKNELWQPIRNIGKFQVCPTCFNEICKRIEDAGFNRRDMPSFAIDLNKFIRD